MNSNNDTFINFLYISKITNFFLYKPRIQIMKQNAVLYYYSGSRKHLELLYFYNLFLTVPIKVLIPNRGLSIFDTKQYTLKLTT